MQSNWNNRFVLLPATAWLLVMLVLPLIVVVVFSFGERGPAGGYVPAFTLAQYANLPARLTAFNNTLILAPLGTLLCLLGLLSGGRLLSYLVLLACHKRVWSCVAGAGSIAEA